MSSATGSTTPPAPAGGGQVELAIGGMTCASCAARIEKRLNKLDGVTATVNYATEKARVTYGGDVAPDDLVAAVEKAGYTARLPEPPQAGPADGEAGSEEDTAVRAGDIAVATAPGGTTATPSTADGGGGHIDDGHGHG